MTVQKRRLGGWTKNIPGTTNVSGVSLQELAF